MFMLGMGEGGGDGGGSLSGKGGVAKRHLLEVQANRCANLISYLLTRFIEIT